MVQNILNNLETNLINQTIEHSDTHTYIQPTIEQINFSIHNSHYSDISAPLNTVCSISLEQFQENDDVSIIKGCGHIFTANLLKQHFQTSSLCPNCRFDIRNYYERTILISTNTE